MGNTSVTETESLSDVLDKLNDEDRPSFFNLRKAPATIRNNNPGAVWHTERAKKFRSYQYEKLNDGLNQKNQMAMFIDAIDGAAYMFDTLDKVYFNKTLRNAIQEWSGGNHVQSYLSVIKDRAGLDEHFYITRAHIRDPKWAIPFAMAMAAHETGLVIKGKLQDYPLDYVHWERAHAQAFDKTPVPMVTDYTNRTTEVVKKKPFSLLTFLAGIPVVLSDSFDNVVNFARETATTVIDFGPVKTVATTVVDNQWLVGMTIVAVSGAVVIKKWREGEE